VLDEVFFSKISNFLACPNDKNDLEFHSKFLKCTKCQRKFNILDDNIIDFVSDEQINIETSVTDQDYSKYYDDLRNLGHSSETSKRFWGLKSHKLMKGFIDKRCIQFQNLIKNSVVCDIGAAIGDYSLEFAKNSELVFHCDLDLESILHVSKLAKKRKLDNIFFIRCDYFYLPFKNNSLPSITCIDILMRGPEHDDRLLPILKNCLESDGLLILDFHTLERTKMFKSHPLPDVLYSKSKLVNTLNKFDIKIKNLYGDGYFPFIKKLNLNIYKIGDALCKLIFPPARWIAICSKK
jgi:ubiquinone/menaquinone biosynthesis C-methylase UbiE